MLFIVAAINIDFYVGQVILVYNIYAYILQKCSAVIYVGYKSTFILVCTLLWRI